jgi:hypothetical protein
MCYTVEGKKYVIKSYYQFKLFDFISTMWVRKRTRSFYEKSKAAFDRFFRVIKIQRPIFKSFCFTQSSTKLKKLVWWVSYYAIL